MLTRASHCAISWGRWIQSASSHPTSLRSIFISSFNPRLGLQMALYLQIFRLNFECISHFSACPIVLWLMNAIDGLDWQQLNSSQFHKELYFCGSLRARCKSAFVVTVKRVEEFLVLRTDEPGWDEVFPPSQVLRGCDVAQLPPSHHFIISWQLTLRTATLSFILQNMQRYLCFYNWISSRQNMILPLFATVFVSSGSYFINLPTKFISEHEFWVTTRERTLYLCSYERIVHCFWYEINYRHVCGMVMTLLMSTQNLLHNTLLYSFSWTAGTPALYSGDYGLDYRSGPVSIAARSKSSTAFDRSNIGIAGSNPARGMDVCLCFSVLCCPV
jgi:hypothetical protein